MRQQYVNSTEQSNEPGRNAKALPPTTYAAIQRRPTLARNGASARFRPKEFVKNY
jgi:hypothetical protein